MFTLEDFAKSDTGQLAIRCDTEEQSIQCCAWMDSVGKRWRWGGKYPANTKWKCKSSQNDIYYTDNGGWDYSHDRFDIYLEQHDIIVMPCAGFVSRKMASR